MSCASQVQARTPATFYECDHMGLSTGTGPTVLVGFGPTLMVVSGGQAGRRRVRVLVVRRR